MRYVYIFIVTIIKKYINYGYYIDYTVSCVKMLSKVYFCLCSLITLIEKTQD